VAQKVQILLVDDLDGGEATETVEFGIEGVSYQIDLSNANARKLRDVLAPYVAEARRLGSRSGRAGRSTRSKAARSTGAGSAAQIREWARANGLAVPDRGRVSADVREAYENAH